MKKERIKDAIKNLVKQELKEWSLPAYIFRPATKTELPDALKYHGDMMQVAHGHSVTVWYCPTEQSAYLDMSNAKYFYEIFVENEAEAMSVLQAYDRARTDDDMDVNNRFLKKPNKLKENKQFKVKKYFLKESFGRNHDPEEMKKFFDSALGKKYVEIVKRLNLATRIYGDPKYIPTNADHVEAKKAGDAELRFRKKYILSNKNLHWTKVHDEASKRSGVKGLHESKQFKVKKYFLKEAIISETDSADEIVSYLKQEERHFAAFLKGKSYRVVSRGTKVEVRPSSNSFTLTVDYPAKKIYTTGKPPHPESTSYFEILDYLENATKFKTIKESKLNEGKASDIYNKLSPVEQKTLQAYQVKANKDKSNIKKYADDIAKHFKVDLRTAIELLSLTESKLNEGVMSELDILAQESKDVKTFIKEAEKLLGQKADRETIKWLHSMYKDSKSRDGSVNELEKRPVSGTKAGWVEELEYRKYVLKKDVNKAVVGGKYIVTLPKGTIVWNLKGGVFAQHPSLERFYKTPADKKWGVGVRQVPEILLQIEKNSKILENKLNEKSVSQSQQQAAGIALAAKRGDIPKSDLKGASKEMVKMSEKDLEDFAKTTHKGLPDKVEGVNEGVRFEKKLKNGNIFQVIDRDTRGMRGTQDKFQMQIVDKNGKVVKNLGSHPSAKGAEKFGARFETKKKVNEEEPCWDGYKQYGMKKKNGKSAMRMRIKPKTDESVRGRYKNLQVPNALLSLEDEKIQGDTIQWKMKFKNPKRFPVLKKALIKKYNPQLEHEVKIQYNRNTGELVLTFHEDDEQIVHSSLVYNGFFSITEGLLTEGGAAYVNEDTGQVKSKGGKNSLLLEDLIKDIHSSDNPLDTRILLLCGGAAGHMSHPFDEHDLTFGDIKQIVDYGLQGKLDVEESVSEKCISGDSIVILENNGPTKISDLVDNNINDSVLAYNTDTLKDEFLPVLNKFNNDVTDEWLLIELENGYTIKVTPNHKIYTNNRGFVRADELNENDDLKII